MANRRFEMFQYRHVIHRMRMGDSDRTIAKSGLMGRTKCGLVRINAQQHGWLDPVPLPDDEVLAQALESEKKPNATQVSLSHRHAQQINRWVEDGVCATTIHRALVDHFNFAGSYSSVRRLVQQIRKRTPKATCILDFAPGDAAQVDFGKGPDITDAFTGETLATWIFVMTLCFSRHMYAEIVTNQKVETWLACHRRALEWFGGVTGRLIIDNPKCAIVRACFHDPVVQRSYAGLAEGYGFLIAPCPPRDPQKKGRVEAGVKYVKNSFVPLRQFRSLADANAQLQAWVMGTAGNRIHGTTFEKPLNRFAEREKHLLRPLPDVPPQIAVWTRAKLHGDCHVRFEKIRYSAPFRLVHQNLWLKATDNAVKIYHELKLVAVHGRLFRPGSRSTVDEHLPPEALAYKMRDPQWCLRQAEAIGHHCLRLVRQLFAHRVLDNLRAAQGVIALAKKYGAARMEAACRRALFYGDPRYRAVKSILNQGLDHEPLPDTGKVIQLADTYTRTGRFLRPGDGLSETGRRGCP
jgi:transposase